MVLHTWLLHWNCGCKEALCKECTGNVVHVGVQLCTDLHACECARPWGMGGVAHTCVQMGRATNGCAKGVAGGCAWGVCWCKGGLAHL